MTAVLLSTIPTVSDLDEAVRRGLLEHDADAVAGPAPLFRLANAGGLVVAIDYAGTAGEVETGIRDGQPVAFA